MTGALHDAGPAAVCDGCGRSTWAATALGQTCNMPQPGGETCPGTMQPYGAADSSRYRALTSPRPGGYAQALRSNDRLVTFLYVLMRDHLPPGVVEEIVVGHCETEKMSAFSNDWVAAYAIELALRLAHAPRGEALAYAHARLREAQAEPAGGA